MLELLTPDEMAEVDRRAIAQGVAGRDLMERAGAAVADVARRSWPQARRILVLAGPGSNGGDGFVAARRLAASGVEVRIALLGGRSDLRGEAAAAASGWTGATLALDEAPLPWTDLVIDALFGAGLSRPLEGAARRAVAALGERATPVLAIDMPSGVEGATGTALKAGGAPAAGDAVQADETVTFVRLKPGHLLLPGRTLCGVVHLADIGVPSTVVGEIGATAFHNRPALWRDALPKTAVDGHKYTRGHVAVWSGPALAGGASRLTATAALRAGTGAVTLVGARDALLMHATHVTAVMMREASGGDLGAVLRDAKIAAMALGPGAGASPELHRAIGAALDAGCAVVLDADVFTLFAGRSAALAAALGGRTAILTPHEGEFARLFGSGHAVFAARSKLERARAAAAALGAVVVLKGADTVVAAPDGRASIADNAPPSLATAGAGDVLAGICAGLLAQRMPAFEAACAAVWIHGDAAAGFGPGLIADDLPGLLPHVLQRLARGAA